MTPSLAAQTSIVFDPILPIGAVVLLGLAMTTLTIAIYRRVGTRLSVGQSGTLLLFRLLGVALVLLLLLQPSRVEEIPPPLTNRVTLVAVDDSRSMAQKDVEQGTRSQAARALLADASLVKPDGTPADHDTRLFQFGEDATPMKSVADLKTAGASTRVHRSISTIISSLGANDSARALLIFSDGHDFELTNPAKTGFLARQRAVPIYAVALGKQGTVRDVSVRITSYQPYCYVKQKARISGALRLIGCELETLNVELVRGDQVVQTQKLHAGDEPEMAVNFDVTEPAVGQYEYEIRVTPLPNEADTENNRALTYLNVIDQQIQVLFLEGSPYWDTTFLQRSLMRNDKMNVDSIVQYADGKARVVRKKPGETELKIPATADEWRRYDVVVLGRSVEKLLGTEALRQLEDYVKNHGGTVIFSRGRAFGNDTPNELEPVIWSAQPTEHVRLQVAREGQALAPFRTITGPGSADNVPDLIASYGVTEKKSLAATLATAQAADGGEAVPVMVHRRFGEGQVLSVGVDGLWRWAFNAKIEGVNTLFDRFWDQMILWLMAGRDFLPTQQFALRANSANIPLGEKIYFRAIVRDSTAKKLAADIPLTVHRDKDEAGHTTLRPDATAADKLTAEFLAPKPGKYTATAKFPDGTTQTARFVVFDDNLEQTEVATDSGYLRKLCESSGGRLLLPSELNKLLDELKNDKFDSSPIRKLTSAWDRVWIFWLIGLLFGVDWYLRRRWGLA
ncbi:MAG: hypothetical protein ABJF10_14565 [Chthoniobacter sp.]|uniref:hypothetical protein n=1 Tax=Chthoniobacter sp. TaxID=2510640 RepID=UPI0032ABF506